MLNNGSIRRQSQEIRFSMDLSMSNMEYTICHNSKVNVSKYTLSHGYYMDSI